MTLTQWSERADYLKKRYDYARHIGSAQTEAWRLNLLAHLEAEPDSDTTPLPEITEPSTVEKFGDDIWGEWMNHQHGAVVPVMRGVPCCIWFADGSVVETNAAPDYFWPGVHKYRIAKERL